VESASSAVSGPGRARHGHGVRGAALAWSICGLCGGYTPVILDGVPPSWVMEVSNLWGYLSVMQRVFVQMRPDHGFFTDIIELLPVIV
jgi:hypothetical protein